MVEIIKAIIGIKLDPVILMKLLQKRKVGLINLMIQILKVITKNLDFYWKEGEKK